MAHDLGSKRVEDDEIVEKAIRALGLHEVVPELYRDLLQPATREIGKHLLTVAQSISIAMAPLEGAVWSYDRIKGWLAVKLTARLASTDPSQIQPPPMSIAGPVLLQLHFTADEAELRELYANLLASSMDARTVTQAHPAYVHVIQQLCADEARLLSHIAAKPRDFRLSESFGLNYTPSERYLDIESQFKELCIAAGVRCVDQSDTYLDNLKRLNLLLECSADEVEYVPGGPDRYGDYSPSIKHGVNRELSVTAFGRQFFDSCVCERRGGA